MGAIARALLWLAFVGFLFSYVYSHHYDGISVWEGFLLALALRLVLFGRERE